MNKTVNSFVYMRKEEKFILFTQAIEVENVQHTQRLIKKLEDEKVNFNWYGILYDNEHISEGLRGSLPFHMGTDFDVLQVVKDEGATVDGDGMIQCPRFFRKTVTLPEESLMPSKLQDLRYSLVMDGWIKPHVKD